MVVVVVAAVVVVGNGLAVVVVGLGTPFKVFEIADMTGLVPVPQVLRKSSILTSHTIAPPSPLETK